MGFLDWLRGRNSITGQEVVPKAENSRVADISKTDPVMEIEGEIEHFGLQEWWLNDLTNDERETILSVYKPLGFGVSPNVNGKAANPLIKGKIGYSSRTAIGLLSGLSSWFNKPEYRQINYKIIKKAEELAPNENKVMDLHFLYQSKITSYYRNRNIDASALSAAIEACKQQIAISEKAKRAFKREFNGPLPTHVGYQQLCVIMEKRKNYEEVIRLATIAKEQGWNGDWDRRISKCKKKLDNNTKGP